MDIFCPTLDDHPTRCNVLVLNCSTPCNVLVLNGSTPYNVLVLDGSTTCNVEVLDGSTPCNGLVLEVWCAIAWVQVRGVLPPGWSALR